MKKIVKFVLVFALMFIISACTKAFDYDKLKDDLVNDDDFINKIYGQIEIQLEEDGYYMVGLNGMSVKIDNPRLLTYAQQNELRINNIIITTITPDYIFEEDEDGNDFYVSRQEVYDRLVSKYLMDFWSGGSSSGSNCNITFPVNRSTTDTEYSEIVARNYLLSKEMAHYHFYFLNKSEMNYCISYTDKVEVISVPLVISANSMEFTFTDVMNGLFELEYYHHGRAYEINIDIEAVETWIDENEDDFDEYVLENYNPNQA